MSQTQHNANTDNSTGTQPDFHHVQDIKEYIKKTYGPHFHVTDTENGIRVSHSGGVYLNIHIARPSCNIAAIGQYRGDTIARQVPPTKQGLQDALREIRL